MLAVRIACIQLSRWHAMSSAADKVWSAHDPVLPIMQSSKCLR
jgi:hypothetical protein